MSNILAIVILSGASCYSPVEQAPRMTVAYQVPCAVVIRQQSANPFKRLQEPNTIAPAPALARNAAGKGKRCGGGKVIWLKKKKNKPRRYRCA